MAPVSPEGEAELRVLSTGILYGNRSRVSIRIDCPGGTIDSASRSLYHARIMTGPANPPVSSPEPRRAVFEYLRISVTDRCNLRCVYCMPAEGVPKLSHDDVLRYEEILAIARAAVAEGVFRIRLTGGEPLVRKGLSGLISSLREIPGLRDLALTTNGILLADQAEGLKKAGLTRVNVSLDSLRPDRFTALTRGGDLQTVLTGIDKALEAGLNPVKINVVIVPGTNDDEIGAFASFAQSRPIEVRFIERMPFSHGEGEKYLSRQQIIDRLIPAFSLQPEVSVAGGGPAEVFAIGGGQGKLGFISSRTNPFCRRCNRLRLTASGVLLPCLDSPHGIKVRNLTDQALREVIQRLALEKSRSGKGCAEFESAGCRSLSDIGG